MKLSATKFSWRDVGTEAAFSFQRFFVEGITAGSVK